MEDCGNQTGRQVHEGVWIHRSRVVCLACSKTRYERQLPTPSPRVLPQNKPSLFILLRAANPIFTSSPDIQNCTVVSCITTGKSVPFTLIANTWPKHQTSRRAIKISLCSKKHYRKRTGFSDNI